MFEYSVTATDVYCIRILCIMSDLCDLWP